MLSCLSRFTFASAPVNLNNQITMHNLYEYAALYACGRPVPLNIRLMKSLPKDLISFRSLCDKHNTLELYLWLSHRFPQYFIEREQCILMKNYAIHMIEASLPSHSFQDKSTIETKYLSTRNKLKNIDVLPPLSYGKELRSNTEENLSKIPPELHYVQVERGRKHTTPTIKVKFGRKGDAILDQMIDTKMGRKAAHSPKSHGKKKSVEKKKDGQEGKAINNDEIIAAILNST
jgi:hypothetical protein